MRVGNVDRRLKLPCAARCEGLLELAPFRWIVRAGVRPVLVLLGRGTPGSSDDQRGCETGRDDCVDESLHPQILLLWPVLSDSCARDARHNRILEGHRELRKKSPEAGKFYTVTRPPSLGARAPTLRSRLPAGAGD